MHTHLNNGILLLKHGPSKRTLPSIVEPIRVGAVLYQQPDEICVSVICGEHELETKQTCVSRGGTSREISKGGRGGVWQLMLSWFSLTKVSPFSLVRLGGRPAGSACSNTAMSPFLAESYIWLANATSSGVRPCGTPAAWLSDGCCTEGSILLDVLFAGKRGLDLSRMI